MSSMPWFRLYAETVDDSKLRLLAFEDRWHYIALLCLKCQGILDARLDLAHMRRMVAVKLGVDMRTLDEIERRLVGENLVEKDTLQPLQWDKRQFQSNSSAARTREWRERQRLERDTAVTSPRRHGDGLEADADTENESTNVDSSRGVRQNKHEYSPEFEEAWALYPKRSGMNKRESFRAWSARLNHKDPEKRFTAEQMTAGTRRYAAHCRAMDTEGRFIKQPATFYGPDGHFMEEWEVPAPRVVGGSPAAGARAQRSEWFGRMTGNNNGGNDARTGTDFIDVPARQVAE